MQRALVLLLVVALVGSGVAVVVDSLAEDDPLERWGPLAAFAIGAAGGLVYQARRGGDDDDDQVLPEGEEAPSLRWFFALLVVAGVIGAVFGRAGGREVMLSICAGILLVLLPTLLRSRDW